MELPIKSLMLGQSAWAKAVTANNTKSGASSSAYVALHNSCNHATNAEVLGQVTGYTTANMKSYCQH